MLVTGGSPWRARVASAAVALALVAGCGGRTSTLDPDVYDTDPPDSYGGSSTGGSGSTPVAGASSSPTAGTGGSVGTNTAKVCDGYCNGYEQKCRERLEGDCRATCAQEMTGFGPKCNKAGLAALKCLSPFFKNASLSCDAAVGDALTKCAKQVANFDDCKGGDPEPQPPQPVPTPQPMPTPMPTPTPNPMPTEYPGYCPGMGESTGSYCKESYGCAEGVYTISCTLSAAGMLHDCACYWPNGSGQGFSVYPNRSPCLQAAEVCGFRPPILK